MSLKNVRNQSKVKRRKFRLMMMKTVARRLKKNKRNR